MCLISDRDSFGAYPTLTTNTIESQYVQQRTEQVAATVWQCNKDGIKQL